MRFLPPFFSPASTSGCDAATERLSEKATSPQHYTALDSQEHQASHTVLSSYLLFSFSWRVFSRCTDFHICVSTSSLPHPIKTKSTGFVVSSSYRGGKEKKNASKKSVDGNRISARRVVRASMLAKTKRESSAVALSKEEKSGRKEQRSL